jgi:hypothetical protein
VPRPVFFICDGHDQEEISFQNRPTDIWSGGTTRHLRQTICQFHRQHDYQANIDFDEEYKNVISLKNYAIDAVIESDGHFSATAEVEFEVLEENARMMRYNLCNVMSIDEMSDASGAPCVYIWEPSDDQFLKGRQADLIIFPNTSWHQGEVSTIIVEYGGDLLEKDFGEYSVKSTYSWFPRYGYQSRTTFDLTFRTPKDLDFVCVGKKLDDHIEDDVRLSRWWVDEPTTHVCFNMGSFHTHDTDVEDIPPVTVFKSQHGRLGSMDMEKNVAIDITNSVQFFEKIFGPYPFEHLYATEIPDYYGISFPGLLYLSWVTFQRGDSKGYNELFRAHEVAHQWWGNGVGFKTYHDQWISEGFANYAGLWYVQLALQGNKRFFEMLKQWRDDIFDNRKYLLGSGAEAGPICMGYRTSSSETRGDYLLIIYKKAAFVLHMLRNMCIDLNTMSEDRFTNLLKDFYQNYRGKNASTRDFQRMVEKHLGMDMDWFFQQWIYGTDLPTYEFSHSTSQDADGKYLLSCRVIQEDVPDDFKMYVPMTVLFEGDRQVRLRVLIDQPVKDFTLPPLPSEPRKVVFNDFYSVLARVEYD